MSDPIRRADPALLEQALEGVERTPASASFGEWAQAAARAAADAIGHGFAPLRRLAASHPDALAWLSLALLAVLTVIAVVLTWRALVRPRVPSLPERRAVERQARRSLREARDWRAELERRLAAGDGRGAAEALWWFLATTLAGPGAGSSWTGRDLLEQAGRPDLLPLAALLDRLVYGPVQPGPAEVRALLDRTEAALR